MGERLTDIGVGTGYYLKHAPATHAISLMVKSDSLKIAASRDWVATKIRATTARCFRHVPGGLARALRFPVSMYYLLHCWVGNKSEGN